MCGWEAKATLGGGRNESILSPTSSFYLARKTVCSSISLAGLRYVVVNGDGDYHTTWERGVKPTGKNFRSPSQKKGYGFPVFCFEGQKTGNPLSQILIKQGSGTQPPPFYGKFSSRAYQQLVSNFEVFCLLFQNRRLVSGFCSSGQSTLPQLPSNLTLRPTPVPSG